MTEINNAELLELLNELTEKDLEGHSMEKLVEVAAKLDASSLPPNLTKEEEEDPLLKEGTEHTDVRAALAEMELPGRMKMALFGNSICRGLLIRDSNKLVQQFVLKNPKLTLKEVEEFSRNQHLTDFILRFISESKTWMKSSLVKYNLVTNAKTPQDISLKWLRYLQSHEIRKIAKSKNIPQLVATTAKKLAQDRRD